MVVFLRVFEQFFILSTFQIDLLHALKHLFILSSSQIDQVSRAAQRIPVQGIDHTADGRHNPGAAERLRGTDFFEFVSMSNFGWLCANILVIEQLLSVQLPGKIDSQQARARIYGVLL